MGATCRLRVIFVVVGLAPTISYVRLAPKAKIGRKIWKGRQRTYAPQNAVAHRLQIGPLLPERSRGLSALSMCKAARRDARSSAKCRGTRNRTVGSRIETTWKRPADRRCRVRQRWGSRRHKTTGRQK